MKKYLLLFVLLFPVLASQSATEPMVPALSASPVSVPADPIERLASLSMKEVQKLAGRKLTLKEKIAVKLYQWKLKKGLRHAGDGEKSSKGKTALIFSIIGLACLFIPISVVGFLGAVVFTVLGMIKGSSAKKEDPNDGNAKAAVIIGWVTIGLFAIALVIATVFLATWSWL